MPLTAPKEKTKQNKVKKSFEAFKSWPTKVMTQTRYNTWKDLLAKKDEYLKIIARYNQGHIRNVKRFEKLKTATKNILNDSHTPEEIENGTKEYLEYLCKDALDAYVKENGKYPKDPFSFNKYLSGFLKHNPEAKANFYKYNPEFDAQVVVPPEILAHIKEFEENDATGKIIITKDQGEADKVQTLDNLKQLYTTGKVNARKSSGRAKKPDQSKSTDKSNANTNIKFTPEAIEGILTGSYSEITDNHTLKNIKRFGNGLINILSNKKGNTPEEKKKIQHERFEIMKKQFDEFGLSSSQRKQIIDALIEYDSGKDFFDDEYDDVFSSEDDEFLTPEEDRVYNPDELRNYMNNLTEAFEIKIPKTRSLTEAFLDLIGKRLDSDTLKEDDSPADFATGLNNAVTSQSGVDTNTSDTSSSTSSTTDTTSSSGSSDDFDYTPDSGDDFGGGFGGITGPNGSATIPDDDSETSMAIPQADYKVVDILVNDKDTSQVKVKIQNTETKEIEIVDLSDIDV